MTINPNIWPRQIQVPNIGLPYRTECGTNVAVTLPSRRSVARRSALGVVVLALLTGICGPARADELRLTLTYSAPPECPSAEAMQSAVRRLATKQTKPYSASVVINTRDERHFSALITASDGTGRTLVGASCEEVAEATAVVLALAISPSSPQEPTAPASSTVAAPPPSSPATRRSSSSSGLVHLKLGAAAVLDLGTMPQVDLGLAGRVGATARLWSAAVEAAYWLPGHRAPNQNQTGGGDFSWWAVLATGCLAPRDGSPRIELCAGPELGQLTGQASLGGAPHSSIRFGFQALAEIHVPLAERLRLRAGLGAEAVVLGRHRFDLEGSPLYQPQLFAGRAAIGAEFIF